MIVLILYIVTELILNKYYEDGKLSTEDYVKMDEYLSVAYITSLVCSWITDIIIKLCSG